MMKSIIYVVIIVVVVGLGVWAVNLGVWQDDKGLGLTSKEWTWVSSLYNDGRELRPNKEGDFTLTFKEDGRVDVKTDCNSMGGEYAVEGNQLTFSNMMMTLMFCEGSKESDFANILENTASYFFTKDGDLILELKYDSGTATFR